MVRMHDNQREIDIATARRLVAEQFPQWRGEPVAPVAGSGTVNAIFRVGADLAARFPLTGTEAETLARLQAEASGIDELASCSPFPAPRHVALGEPGEGFGLHWSVQTWIAGDIATPFSVAGSDAFAGDLVELITALRAKDTRGRRFAGARRGGELRAHDAWVATCIRESASTYDAGELAALWLAARALPREGADVMTHGDLIPANVVVRDGRLAGILDTGGFGPADPALELVCAWHLLDDGPRDRLRTGLGVGELEWLRAAAWAFVQAMGLDWYYRKSNPMMAELGRATMGRLLGDAEVRRLAWA